MLRLGRLPEAWIAPPAIRELRELVRYRAKLVQLRSGLKAQVHAVMAKEGVLPQHTDMFCVGGNRQLDGLELGVPFAMRVQSLRGVMGVYDREITALEREIHRHLKGDRGYRAVQANQWHRPDQRRSARRRDRRCLAVPDASASLFVGRFDAPPSRIRSQDASRSHLQAGVTSGARNVDRGDQPLPRRDAPRRGVSQHCEATRAQPGAHRVGAKVLTLVYYGLRDGEIRCLAPAQAA